MQKSETHECESLVVAVPQQLFRAPLYLALYESWKSWLAISLLFSSLIALGSLYMVDYTWKILVGIVFSVLLFLFFMSTGWRIFSTKRLVSKNKAQLAKVLYEVAPGIDSQKWDEVTYRMNDFLYQKGLWRTPYCIFNSETCRQYFRIYLMQPFIEGTLDPQQPNEMEDEKDYVELCVTHYERAVRDEFERVLRIELPDSLGEYQTLPRELNCNKYTWMSKQLATKRFGILLTFFILFACGYIVNIRSNYFGYLRPFYRSVFSCLLGSIIGVGVSFFRVKLHGLGLSERVMFLATIIKVSNGFHSERLDQIARYMNHYLRSEEIWKGSQEYFFDGEECLSFFREQFEPLALNKKLSADVVAYYELKDFVPLAQESLESPR